MELLRFKVTNFRSVADSNWVSADRVTALIGVNESGKTNLLLPLWKLNPAHDGDIEANSDYPKSLYTEIRKNPGEYRFIEAIFNSESHAAEIAKLTGAPSKNFNEVSVSKYYDGRYAVTFPHYETPNSIGSDAYSRILDEAFVQISEIDDVEGDASKSDCLRKIESGKKKIGASEEISRELAEEIVEELRIGDGQADDSGAGEILQKYANSLATLSEVFELLEPGDNPSVFDYFMDHIPSFVYYSNYGNLDSEIYLPHVIENRKRKDLTGRQAAKVRTLNVLFKFVDLEPEEILELGKDFRGPPNQPQPTEEQIAAVAEKKRTRSMLLQAAGTKLTGRFHDWWKQGNYTFRFEADGDHFRIWVKDERRPAEVELEGRSTGLQWFLSFYLVFLVESMGNHRNCILLLDEPGVSLHPLAQMDLTKFFDSLSGDNQLLYTTHSPFLIDANRLDLARKVYVDNDGTTKATGNLRQGEHDKAQPGAAYAVHSALGLRVAESLLLGCTPVIVEGPSDQHYASAIKTLLIKAKKLNPGRELVFPPCGGTPQVRAVAAILGSKEDSLPYVLLDGDTHGQKAIAELKSGIYQGEKHKVLNVDAFTGVEGSEIEDLMPRDLLARCLDKIVNQRPEVDFQDTLLNDGLIVPQIEKWAKDQNIDLPEHWKVDLSIEVKKRLLNSGPKSLDADIMERWSQLFKAFSN